MNASLEEFLEGATRIQHERDLLERNDADGAVERLQVIAGYLARGEVVPANLAKYLADAIEGSMRGELPVERKRDSLLQSLGLKALGKRAIGKAEADAIGWAMFSLCCRDESVNGAALSVALEFGCGETTAKRFFEELCAKLAADREIG